MMRSTVSFMISFLEVMDSVQESLRYFREKHEQIRQAENELMLARIAKVKEKVEKV